MKRVNVIQGIKRVYYVISFRSQSTSRQKLQLIHEDVYEGNSTGALEKPEAGSLMGHAQKSRERENNGKIISDHVVEHFIRII